MGKDEIRDMNRWEVFEVLFRPKDPDREEYFPVAPARPEVLARKDALSDKRRYWELFMGVHLDLGAMAEKSRRDAVLARQMPPPVLMPQSVKRGR